MDVFQELLLVLPEILRLSFNRMSIENPFLGLYSEGISYTIWYNTVYLDRISIKNCSGYSLKGVVQPEILPKK